MTLEEFESIRGQGIYEKFKHQFNKFRSMKSNRFTLSWKNCIPCLDDWTGTCNFDTQYVYHIAWAARVLAETRPSKHIDISSSIYFPAIVSAFVPMDYYEYRPTDIFLSNLTTKHADLLELPFGTETVESLSCLHTIEHIGLGRYNDVLDPDGDLKSIAELKRVIRKGGNLLIAVPIGQSELLFNAHRIYSYDQITSYFSDLRLVRYDLIPDDAYKTGMIYNATKNDTDIQIYGCGCFQFTKE